MFCYKCGSSVSDVAKFCSICGAPKSATGATTAPPESTPAPPEPSYTPPTQSYTPPPNEPQVPADARQETADTLKQPYGETPKPPYGAQQPYGETPKPPYGAQQPYGETPKPPYGAQQPYGETPKPPYGAQQPYGETPKPPYGAQQPYGETPQPPYGAQQPYGGAPQSPYGAQQPYGGAPQPPYGAQQPYYAQGGQYGEAPAEKKGPSKKMLTIIISAVAVVALAVAAYFIFFASAKSAVERSIENLTSEISERIDGTPLKAVGMLLDTLQEGTTTVNFNYFDQWYGSEYSGSVRLLSNAQDMDYAILVDLNLDGMSVDVEAYIDRDRIAVGTKLLDDNYYGLTYSTFRNDIRAFGNLVGLDSQTMNQLADVVEFIDQAMDSEPRPLFSQAEERLFNDFIEACEISSESAQITSGGASVRCTRIDVVVTKEAVMTLLNGYYSIIRNDESIRNMLSIFDNSLMEGMFYGYGDSYYDMFMDEFQIMIREFERYYSGEIYLSFFIGSGDRLLRVAVDTDIVFDGSQVGVMAVLDFGSSVQDRWEFEITIYGEYGRDTVNITWDYRAGPGSVENTITITTEGGLPFTLGSTWSAGSGDFTLYYSEYWDYTAEFRGNFTSTADSFRLALDPLPFGFNASLYLEVLGEPGARIRQIEYINLDRWGTELLDAIENMMWGMMF